MAEIEKYVVVSLIFLLCSLVRSFFHKQPSPPSPLALPIIGHFHLLKALPHQALAKLSWRYGPLISIRLGSVTSLVASSHEVAEEILKTQESYFSNRPQKAAISYLTYGSQDFMFAPYGPHWRFMKKLCMTRLLGAQATDQQKPIRDDERKQLIEFFRRAASASKDVKVGVHLIRMTNNVVSRMIMSQRWSEDDEDGAGKMISEMVREISELAGKFNLSDYIWFCKNLDLQGIEKRCKEERDRFDNMMEKIIDEHQMERRKSDGGGGVGKDLLHVLLDVAEDESSEMKLTRDHIKAFFQNLLVAGSDSSALIVEWALSELINHPHIMQNAVQELDSFIGKNRHVEESDISSLPYLQAIVKETFRLHPPGPIIPRMSRQDCNIAGYHIPANTGVIINVWAIGRDPNHWENHLEFRPERFLSEKGKHVDVRGQHYQLLPFGSGRRACPAISSAMKVVQTTLAAMLHCFEWKVDGAVDMEEGSGLGMPRAHPLVCTPVPRLNPFPTI